MALSRTGRPIGEYRAALRREARVACIWIAAAVAAGAAAGLAVRPILAAPGLVPTIEQLPVPLPAILGVTDIARPDRLLDAALSGLIAPLLFLSYGIGVGSRALGVRPRPADRAAPIRPLGGQQALTEAASMATALIAIGIALLAGATIGAGLGLLALDPARLITVIAAAGLLGLMFGATTLAVAAATGWPTLANWTVTGLAVAADAANSLAPAVGGLLPLRYVSPLYYAESGHPLERGVSAAHLGVLSAAAVAAVMLATAAAMVALRRSAARSDTMAAEKAAWRARLG